MIRTALGMALLIVAPCVAAVKPGEYTGTYNSNEAGAGTIRTILKMNEDSSWDCRFYFVYEGEEIAAKTTACSIDGDKLTGEYDADVQGSSVHTRLTGQVAADNGLEGVYAVKNSEGSVVSEGTWKASLKP